MDYNKEVVTRCAPRWAWELIDETLEKDSQSKSFDKNLREQIENAIRGMDLSTENPEVQEISELDAKFGFTLIGSKWRHIKRGSQYEVVGVVDQISDDLRDGDVMNFLWLEEPYHDVGVQISSVVDEDFDFDQPWIVYQSEDFLTFARPAIEFTPDRFESMEAE